MKDEASEIKQRRQQSSFRTPVKGETVHDEVPGFRVWISQRERARWDRVQQGGARLLQPCRCAPGHH